MDFWFYILLSFLAAICWGINAHLVRLGMKGENHFHALFIRAIFAFPILFGIVLVWKGWYGIGIYFQDPIIYYSLISATLVLIGDTFFLIGLKYYSVNIITPITAVYPFFTSLTLILTGEEQVGFVILLGTIIIILGVAMVTSNDITKTFDRNALIIGSLAAICWGVSIFFVRLVLEVDGTDSIGLTGLRMMVIGLTSILIFRVGTSTGRIERTQVTIRSDSFKFMAISGFVGWVLGASFFFAAVQEIGAAISTPISSTNPIIASIIGQVFGIEQVNLKQLFGIVLTVMGVILIIQI